MSLDNIETYAKYDKEEISFGIEHMPEQIRVAWEGLSEFKMPNSHKKPTNVVIVGMGGSALGPHIIQSVYAAKAKVAIEVVRGYKIPASATKKSLVILSSFSGSTEEVLAAAKEGRKRGLKMVIISVGGPLKAFARRYKLPYFTFDPGDLAKQPRLGVGFSLIGLLGILNEAKVLSFTKSDTKRMMTAMADVVGNCSLDTDTKENPAKIVSGEAAGHPMMIIAAEHLVGNAHAFQNQVNETAKQICYYETLPELNHHRLEGLTNPEGMFKDYVVLMLRSEIYHPRVQQRFDLTADVFEKLGAKVIDYNCGGGSELEEAAEILQFGSFVSYYMAMQNKIEGPEKIPYVDWFKEQLAPARGRSGFAGKK